MHTRVVILEVVEDTGSRGQPVERRNASNDRRDGRKILMIRRRRRVETRFYKTSPTLAQRPRR